MNSLTSIRQVADHFGIAISTLHYWERCGLIKPARRGSWRYYDETQVYRIALIHLWRQSGMMSIEQIAELLEVSPRWEKVIEERVDAIDEQMERLARTREYLVHLSSCPHGPELEKCPEFRSRTEIPAPLMATS